MKAPSGTVCEADWSSARKDMVGASLGSSRVWFTVAEGVLTEVYQPRVDIPQIKDLSFIIADDKGFWVELRQHADYEARLPASGVPAVEIIHSHPRFRFTLQICPSQRRDVVLLRIRLEGEAGLRPYALLSPRLGGEAQNNLAAVGRHGGRTTLWAEQGPFGLALCAIRTDGSDAWERCSAGCLGASDGGLDFSVNGRMSWTYDEAGPAAVTLMGRLPEEATLALGLATSRTAAATLALSALLAGFSQAWDRQTEAWEAWLAKGERPAFNPRVDRALAISASMLKVHQDRTYVGAVVASLSIPWGERSTSRSGYHLVWARDLVETAGALIALGAVDEARDALTYLIATQGEDGRWFQNQWLGGTPFWQGVQLDEAAFPVLLAALLKDAGALRGMPVEEAVRRALGFIAREGPVTGQDRWEEDRGVNTFTLAVTIAALVEGADFLQGEARAFALKLADCWNSRVETWCFAKGGSLAADAGVSGYYRRTTPADGLGRSGGGAEIIEIKNLAAEANLSADAQVSTDFLQLVRYGLRGPDDPCIKDSLLVADRLLKVQTPNGAVWRRYNDDGYGERDDGSPFQGSGRGRAWPLLTGERGHYALAAGEDASPYIDAMIAMSSPLGLMPEQVWDAAPIAAYGLKPGEPSGSAMPLVWAHGEFVKLCCSQRLGRPFDRPTATFARYGGVRPVVAYDVWSQSYQPERLAEGSDLTLALGAPARVHWGRNGWSCVEDLDTRDTGLGVHVADLALKDLKAGETVQFTFQWLDSKAWLGRDYEVKIGL